MTLAAPDPAIADGSVIDDLHVLDARVMTMASDAGRS